MVEDGVGDDLLVRRVFLGEVAQHEKVILLGEELREVLIGPCVEALEAADGVEELALHDEDVFRCRILTWCSVGW